MHSICRCFSVDSDDFQDINGNWDGLIRDLLEGNADLAVTSLRISEDRAKAVSFSEPYLETGITIIVAIREGAISATAFLGKIYCLGRRMAKWLRRLPFYQKVLGLIPGSCS